MTATAEAAVVLVEVVVVVVVAIVVVVDQILDHGRLQGTFRKSILSFYVGQLSPGRAVQSIFIQQIKVLYNIS